MSKGRTFSHLRVQTHRASVVHLSRGQCADTERTKPHMSRRNAELWELCSWFPVFCVTASPPDRRMDNLHKKQSGNIQLFIHCLRGGFRGSAGNSYLYFQHADLHLLVCTYSTCAQIPSFPSGQFLFVFSPKSFSGAFLLFSPACCRLLSGAGRCSDPPGPSGPRPLHCLLWERPNLGLQRAAYVYSFGEEVSGVTISLVRLRTMAALQLWSKALLPSELL